MRISENGHSNRQKAVFYWYVVPRRLSSFTPPLHFTHRSCRVLRSYDLRSVILGANERGRNRSRCVLMKSRRFMCVSRPSRGQYVFRKLCCHYHQLLSSLEKIVDGWVVSRMGSRVVSSSLVCVACVRCVSCWLSCRIGIVSLCLFMVLCVLFFTLYIRQISCSYIYRRISYGR